MSVERAQVFVVVPKRTSLWDIVRRWWRGVDCNNRCASLECGGWRVSRLAPKPVFDRSRKQVPPAKVRGDFAPVADKRPGEQRSEGYLLIVQEISDTVAQNPVDVLSALSHIDSATDLGIVAQHVRLGNLVWAEGTLGISQFARHVRRTPDVERSLRAALLILRCGEYHSDLT